MGMNKGLVSQIIEGDRNFHHLDPESLRYAMGFDNGTVGVPLHPNASAAFEMGWKDAQGNLDEARRVFAGSS